MSLAELHVSLVPRPRIEGAGLKLVPRGRRDVPPLLVVSRFTASASWSDVFRRPRRVNDVRLEGLRVTIAPKAEDTGIRDKERGGCQGERRGPGGSEASPVASSPVLIERLTAPGTELELLPRDPGKQSRRFSIASLNVRNMTLDQPLDFDAVLTNPKPKGLITTRGRFGPWVAHEPGLSAVEGRYVFERADLGTIKGIGGSLTSAGRFAGVLQQILVSGATETPDFSLDTAHRPLPLHTDFEACVDGTDGDTYLDSVRARLASTPIDVKGKVEGRVGVDGRTIALDAAVDGGRIEDVLQLVVKGDAPVMTGQVRVQTKVLLPPGPQSVVERLQLKGQFGLGRARFTGPGVQGKIDEFSRRGQGRPEDDKVRNVASDLPGASRCPPARFAWKTWRSRSPARASAARDLWAGQRADCVCGHGPARRQGLGDDVRPQVYLLKAVDALFSRRDAGTVVPITISGTREHPKYGVDMKGVITRKVK